MELRRLSPSDLDHARSLLVANDLPIDDLDDPANELFAAYEGDAVVGVVGLQRCDGAGLLRSLAVDSSRRASGIGRALCERALGAARQHGYDDVYLLTTGAADYFSKLAFTDLDRSSAPAPITATAQFAALCPASARVMRRRVQLDK